MIMDRNEIDVWCIHTVLDGYDLREFVNLRTRQVGLPTKKRRHSALEG